MIRPWSSLPAIACLLLLSASFASAQQQVPPAPVPTALSTARSIFISNGGADSGLFPEPFTGDSSRGYNQLFAALKSAGQFQLVSDPGNADLVLEIGLVAPYFATFGMNNTNKQNGAKDPLPMFKLTVYDAKSHFVLWTMTSSVGFAFLQKTHDRNFDMALNDVVSQFLSVAGKPPLQTPPTP